MADAIDWLLLAYRVPTEPTRHRAAVWRRLKGLGAVYLQNSVAVLPAAEPALAHPVRAGLRRGEHAGGFRL